MPLREPLRFARQTSSLSSLNTGLAISVSSEGIRGCPSRASPGRRRPCRAGLPWLCRPPCRPRLRQHEARGWRHQLHRFRLHAQSGPGSRARSEGTPPARRLSRCCARPESHRLRNCAKVGVLQVRHQACRRRQRGDDRGGVAFTTHPVALRRDGKRRAFRCGQFRPCRPE